MEWLIGCRKRKYFKKVMEGERKGDKEKEGGNGECRNVIM